MLGRLIKSTGFWVGVVVVAVIAVGIWASLEHWGWLQTGSGETSNTAAIRNIALVIGGVVAIFIAIWRSAVADRQATAARRQSEIAERSYLSERYRQAASMLGHSELTVRLGGIYTLERLAEDYPSEFQHEAFKLLLEFVRTPPTLTQPQPKIWDGWIEIERPATRQDVQTAITVIAKLKHLSSINSDTESQFCLDLRGAQLSGADLQGVQFGTANLVNADLTFARLDYANLSGAQLQWSNCRRARFSGADLSNAEMSDADFTEVEARGCNFRGATMPATMSDAELEEADLTDAVFPNTNLTGAELRAANLTGANMRGLVQWIDRAGLHNAEAYSVSITQEQLDEAVADPERPPTLGIRSVSDTEPPVRLVWRGKAPPSNSTES